MGLIRNPNWSTSGMMVTLSYLGHTLSWNCIVLAHPNNGTGSFRPDYLFAPGRLPQKVSLNRYYIIIDEVFFNNILVIIYLLVVYKKKIIT